MLTSKNNPDFHHGSHRAEIIMAGLQRRTGQMRMMIFYCLSPHLFPPSQEGVECKTLTNTSISTDVFNLTKWKSDSW